MNPISENHAVINPEIALKRLGGDEKLLVTLAEFFLEDAPALIAQLHVEVQNAQWESIIRRAHGLRGLSATFEALTFQQLTLELEALARVANREVVEIKFSQLQQEFDRLISDLRELVA